MKRIIPYIALTGALVSFAFGQPNSSQRAARVSKRSSR
jgi:hypothetical protein